MKKLKVNLMMVLALFIGAVAMSFNLANSSTTWHYTSNNAAEITDVSKWEMTDPGLSGCSALNTQIPCQLETPSQVNNKEELETYFDEEFESDATAITQAATTRRNTTSTN